jgi:DNA-binding CsgD family transcriptional regulator
MKHAAVDAKGQQLLELLAEGASTSVLARKLGYSPGTVRVYLHNLYRVIGVKNRTEAVLWHLNRVRPAEKRVAPAMPSALADETFGDVALRDGLLATLGVMESFVGPYGRVWEVALRLKGQAIGADAAPFREDARLLWRALLQGNFGYAKALHDERLGDRMVNEGGAEALLLAMLLLLGGFSHAADACIANLQRARKGGRAVSARELNCLRALRGAMYEEDADGVRVLHATVDEKASPMLRHLALAALFHVHRARKEAPQARDVANALWAQAELAREQLEAMGVRPLSRTVSLASGKPVVKQGVARGEKAAAER